MQKTLLFLIGSAISANAYSTEESPIKWYGFLTSAVTASDQAHPYATNTTLHPNYIKLSKLGLNLSRSITHDISIQGQLLAVREEVKLDWAFATIRLSDTISVHAGRQKFPVWLYSDKISVGKAYNWITPPEEVYRQNPIDSINGITVSYMTEVAGIESSIDLYGGNFEEKFVTVLADGRKLTINASANDVMGANILLTRDWLSIRSGVGRATVSVDTEFYNIANARADFGSAGMSINLGNIEFLTEYASVLFKGKESEKEKADQAAQVAAQKAATSNNEYDKLIAKKTALNATVNRSSYVGGKTGYASVAWHAGDFTPHLTYAKLDSPDNSFIYGDQQSWITGLKYDFNLNTDLKIEWHRIDIADNSWGLYSRDTNNPTRKYEDLNVYSAALDYVF